MDNRSYDPDKQHEEHLEQGPSAEEQSKTLGEHHEQPVPVDPISGIVGDPSAGQQQAPHGSWEVQRQSYPEYVDEAVEHQLPHTSNQPTGAAPPATSAHPGAAGGAETSSPYSPQAYAPGPSVPPPPSEERGKGFNWLACCGIGCGIALVLAIVGGFLTWRVFQPIIKASMELGTVVNEVRSGGAPEGTSVVVTAADLGANPAQYEGQWVELTGEIADDPGPIMADTMRQRREFEDSTTYFIEPNIIVMDVSTSTPSAQQGETVTIIGRPVLFDLQKMLGPFGADKLAEDSELGDNKSIVFLVTDSVTTGGTAASEDESFP